MWEDQWNKHCASLQIAPLYLEDNIVCLQKVHQLPRKQKFREKKKKKGLFQCQKSSIRQNPWHAHDTFETLNQTWIPVSI